MSQENDFGTLMHSVTEKSLQIINEFKDKPNKVPDLIGQFIVLTEHFQALIEAIIEKPEHLWDVQIAYWNDIVSLTQAQFNYWLDGKPMPIKDNRFSADDWVQNPYFNVLSQHYLLASQHMNSLLDQLDFKDPQNSKRVRFFIKQYLDALSPANFVHSNPEIIVETIKSSGANLLQGLNNLLSDLDKDSHHLAIKMTDTDAFKLGENIATTPGKVVFRNKMIELIQYTPQTPSVHSIPLLMIPPWINKYYILDLSPENSLVRYLVQNGITVFMISWVNPDASYAKKSLYHYLKEGPQAAISAIKKQLKVRQVNTFGFCIGGTLMSLLLAYNKAHKDDSVHSASFFASLLDFSDPGDISVFIDEEQILKIEQEMEKLGYLPGQTMAHSFNSLRANDLIWSFFVKNYLSGKTPPPFDLLYWNADSTNMPATMHSQYLRWMYIQNDLIKPGKIQLDKTPIDIHDLQTPCFFLATQKDHIAPWESVFKGFELMQGPKRFVLGGSGHIAGIINPPTHKKYGYKTNNTVNQDAKTWLEQAKEHNGSWWPEWVKWLKKNSGKEMTAPDFADLPLKPVTDAPGTYVLVRSSEK